MFHRLSRDAMLWRSIGIGLGCAALGLVLTVLVLNAASVAPPASALLAGAPVSGPAVSNHRLEIYQDPAEGLTAAMPVP